MFSSVLDLSKCRLPKSYAPVLITHFKAESVIDTLKEISNRQRE